MLAKGNGQPLVLTGDDVSRFLREFNPFLALMIPDLVITNFEFSSERDGEYFVATITPLDLPPDSLLTCRFRYEDGKLKPSEGTVYFPGIDDPLGGPPGFYRTFSL